MYNKHKIKTGKRSLKQKCTRKGIYRIEDVLPYVPLREDIILMQNTYKSRYKQKAKQLIAEKDFDGSLVFMHSLRYQVFAKSLTCTICGVVGKYFALERAGNVKKYHLNLYGIDEKGNEVLMTKDHIHPKSRGGSNKLDNFQTMCMVCNKDKGSFIYLCKYTHTEIAVEINRRIGRDKKAFLNELLKNTKLFRLLFFVFLKNKFNKKGNI